MKKRIVSLLSIFALFLALSMPQNADAASTYSAGASSPSTIYAYSLNSWSELGYWDLRNVSSIPDNAIVTAAKLNWSICTICGMTYNTTSVGLFIQNGSGDWMDSGFYNYNFEDQPVKQIWFTSFKSAKFNSSGYIKPNLTILWEDSASAKSGAFMLNESSTGILVDKDSLVEKQEVKLVNLEEK